MFNMKKRMVILQDLSTFLTGVVSWKYSIMFDFCWRSSITSYFISSSLRFIAKSNGVYPSSFFKSFGASFSNNVLTGRTSPCYSEAMMAVCIGVLPLTSLWLIFSFLSFIHAIKYKVDNSDSEKMAQCSAVLPYSSYKSKSNFQILWK